VTRRPISQLPHPAKVRPRAVFFDLDDTLVYLERTLLVEKMALVCQAMAQQHGVDAEALLGHHRRLTLDLWSRAMEGVVSGRQVRHDTWAEALSACGCDVDGAAEIAADMYWDNRRGIVCLFDDALITLETLRPYVRLAVITNGPADTQVDKLEVHACDTHFELFLASSELGVLKPDPRIFTHACSKLGVAPEDAWHVGDNLASDIAGAKAAGLTAVWLNRTGAAREAGQPLPDYEIASLSELPALLGIPAQGPIGRTIS
jgi:putative hydrolase of the HAD superfamily